MIGVGYETRVLLERNESNENVICDLTASTQRDKDEQSTWGQYGRWAGIASPTKQESKQFLPGGNSSANNGATGMTASFFPEKTTVPTDIPPHQSPSLSRTFHGRTTPSPSRWSKKLKTPNVPSRVTTGSTLGLPSPPLTCSSTYSRRKVVKMDDFAAQRGALWMKDNNLLTTPVFQKRVNPYAILIQACVRRMLAMKDFHRMRKNQAATNIQRIFRGYTLSQTWYRFYCTFKAARSIQKMTRGLLTRRSLRENQAAVTIQRFSRGYMGRLVAKVNRLEKQLASIQAAHAEELDEIRQNKEEFFASPQLLMDAKFLRTNRQAKLAQETISALRANNRALRKENKTLTEQCQVLNDCAIRRTHETAQRGKNIIMLKTMIEKLDKDQKRLLYVSGEFEKTFEETVERVKQVEDMIKFERKISNMYVQRIKEQITLIYDVCDDRDLADSIRRGALSNLEASKGHIRKHP